MPPECWELYRSLSKDWSFWGELSEFLYKHCTNLSALPLFNRIRLFYFVFFCLFFLNGILFYDSNFGSWWMNCYNGWLVLELFFISSWFLYLASLSFFGVRFLFVGLLWINLSYIFPYAISLLFLIPIFNSSFSLPLFRIQLFHDWTWHAFCLLFGHCTCMLSSWTKRGAINIVIIQKVVKKIHYLIHCSNLLFFSCLSHLFLQFLFHLISPLILYSFWARLGYPCYKEEFTVHLGGHLNGIKHKSTAWNGAGITWSRYFDK